MKKIFILEDEIIISNLYKKRLTSEWFLVETSINIENSKKIILENNPDIALLDHWLKEDDEFWLHLIKFIKKESPKTKIIMLSNYSHDELLCKAKREWAYDFLIKLEYTPKKLAEYLKKL